MSEAGQPKPVMVCCAVLEVEVASLCQLYWPDHKLICLPSMMHMHPERLALSLETVLAAELKAGHGVVLIYGDCCPRMTALEAFPGVVRTSGKNCFELLLGAAEYRRLSHEGAFFLLPEWVRRWREIFTGELGLNHTNASSFMQEMHRKLLYLDTGIVPVPEKELQECSEYCGLPSEVRTVSLEKLRVSMKDALLRLETKETHDET